MRHGLSQPPITVVFSDDEIKLAVRLPTNHAWMSFFADDEWRTFLGRVLFQAIDLRSRMICSRSKQMTLVEIGGIDVRTGVDNEGRSASRDLNAQRVVMPVRAAPFEPATARIKK